MTARLLYGFRVSIYFGLALTFVGDGAGHPRSARCRATSAGGST